MRLSAMIGDVRKGVSSDVLDRLPKGKFNEFVDTKGKGKDKEQEGDLACAICLEEYKEDDDCVKMIRCRHFYHAECIQVCIPSLSALQGWLTFMTAMATNRRDMPDLP